MSTTVTLTESPSTPAASTAAESLPQVYGCEHIKNILERAGDRVRQEYDSAMMVVLRSSNSTSRQVKVPASPLFDSEGRLAMIAGIR
jgi:hypothetical protein